MCTRAETPCDPAKPVYTPCDPAKPVRTPRDPAKPVRTPRDPAKPVYTTAKTQHGQLFFKVGNVYTTCVSYSSPGHI